MSRVNSKRALKARLDALLGGPTGRRGRPPVGNWRAWVHTEEVARIKREENVSLKEARRRYAERHNPPMNPDYLKQAQKRASKIDPRDFFIDYN
jgi:hypothetical protein